MSEVLYLKSNLSCWRTACCDTGYVCHCDGNTEVCNNMKIIGMMED